MSRDLLFSVCHAVLIKAHRRGLFLAGMLCGLLFLTSANVPAQAPTFAGNPQHTSVYSAPAQNLNTIKWSTTIDFHPNTTAHYGAPVITASNTVLVPVKTSNDGFRVDAFNGDNGAAKYILNTDYVLPAHNWIPVYNPCLATGSFGTRMYYAGAGGTIFHIDNPDSNSPGAPVREAFYSLANYNANPAAYNNTVFVNTPLTSDAAGNIYFGFRVQGTAPAPLNTSQSGIARIDTNGNGTYVLASSAAGDGAINRVSHNVAPALSSDGSTVYVVVKWSTNNVYAYLLGLNSTTLATKYSAFLKDPRNGEPASVPEDGTASPMVAPDGDVYFGVMAPNSGSRGFLLRFSGDLTVTKTPGGFGWDYTPGIVPASLVPSYTGSSSYLLFSKYNDYAGAADSSGINRVALLDPNATQIDPHSSSGGLIEMREVLTLIGPTPDSGPDPSTFPLAVKEWCINAPAVNPANRSVYFTSEDGRSYRWNLATNTLDQSVVLTPGALEPYVPTVIGPDGTVYTLNGGTFFALGNRPVVNVTIDSSAPDSRAVLVGSTITFTATVIGTPASPTGTVTFTDLTYNGTTPVTTMLASNVPLNASGMASVTPSSLAAGGGFRGCPFITAAYSGDASHNASSVTMVQKIHANATTLALNSSSNPVSFGQTVTFTANVSAVPAGAGTPTGMVTFQDGATIIGQAPLNSSGVAAVSSPGLAPGSHNIVATYASDTQFAASSGSVVQVIQNGTSTAVASTSNPASFGQSIFLDAAVTATNGAPGTPTGSVTFKEGATVLATVPLNSAAHAAFSYAAFSIGSHTITADFAGTNGWLASSGQLVQVVQDAPVLLLEENSPRAIALDLVTQTRDPFSLTSQYNLSSDLRRRISLFVWHLGLAPGDTASDLTVVAEDDQGGTYTLVVEQVFTLPGVGDVNQVVVRLPDSVAGAPRDLQVKVKLRGLFSNKGLLRISGN
jgi:hypothetical protein